MDYDQTDIPATYDKARALAPETRRLWQDLLSVHISRAAVSLVVDVGCGTGRFSELLAGHFSAQVIGIDPSLKMLDQARRKPAIGNVVYCQGLAEAVPFRDGCADLVPPRKWDDKDRFDLVWVFTRTAGIWRFEQVPQLLLAGDKPNPIE